RGDEPRLFDEPAPVAAQVEHEALRALLEAPVDRLAQLAVRAAGELRQRDVGVGPSIGEAPQVRGDDGHGDRRALDGPGAPAAVREDGQAHARPRAPLDPDARRVARLAARRTPSD